MSARTTLDAGAASRCSFRVVLEHDDDVPPPARRAPEEAAARRVDAAGRHRHDVVASLQALHGPLAHDAGRDPEATAAAVGRGALVVLSPQLAPQPSARRHGTPFLLVGALGGGARPVDVHNHLLTTEGSTPMLAASLVAPRREDAVMRPGRRLRRGGIWRADLLRLAHHQRMLELAGLAADGPPFGGVVDRSGVLWWLPLDAALDERGSALEQYDVRFAERVGLLQATEARNADRSRPRPGAPWWHRECETCPFSEGCHRELSERDDVSLVRYTSARDQEVLRTHGVATRRALAALDLAAVRAGVATRDEPADATTPVATAVGRLVADAERLVRRARADLHGAPLRLVEPEALDAARADVEIDFDMESYDNATYVWGSLVTARVPTASVEPGYRAFAEWGPLTERTEGELFARFFAWLSETVRLVEGEGLRCGLYCFYDHAELTQMRRALRSGAEGLPTPAEVDDLLEGRLVDVHRLITSQLQTAGPAGLKVVAQAAGFRWRDEAPSGEASMAWYEQAVRADPDTAAAAMRRVLDYNEDDCRATLALRDWLCGGAGELLDLEGARPPTP